MGSCVRDCVRRVKVGWAEPRSQPRERRFSDVDGPGAGQAGGASWGDAAVADQDVDCGEVGVILHDDLGQTRRFHPDHSFLNVFF
jgi:hypothetical protein